MSQPESLRTKDGNLTPFAFRCGYFETDPKTGLVVWWQHCCYFVGGWLNKDQGIGAVHVSRTTTSLKEARQIARHPFTPSAA
jgi:hypothetical protein